MMRAAVRTLGALASVALAFAGFEGLFDGMPDHPTIQYATQPVKDPVAELNRGIQEGKVQLNFDGAQGYLRSVLAALNVPIESQMVVFSKTSVQRGRISPRNPRTLFFNDSVVVGWVRGGFIELAAEDPRQGVIFYTLDQSFSAYRERTMKLPLDPPFIRTDSCLQCHVSDNTLGVPGMLVRSEFTGPGGVVMRQLGEYLTDHRSPIEQRWGGWYVTGGSGPVRHMGNAMAADPDKPESMVTSETLNLESLKEKFDTGAYLSPYSDIAALMVFDHQMRMINLLTRMGWETRYGLYEEKVNHTPIGTRLRDTANELVDYMLFVDEAPLAGKIQGTSGFSEKFAAQGPWDRKGRSLRQIDLQRRLMRYPCSYMIYTAAFDSLPAEAKEAVCKRLWQILSGEEKNAKYALLSVADRQAIVEILRDTKRDLPDYFQAIQR
jgi:hypothetical protein